MDKALFLGAKGQKLDDKLKEKLAAAVKMAMVNYEIDNFYFLNEPEEEMEENELVKNSIDEQRKISEFIVQKIKEYKSNVEDREIKTAMLVARPNDKNFSAELYDEIIQGYLIYGDELEENENSLDAFSLRDSYLAENIDIVFWYSNKILTDTSTILYYFKGKVKYI